MNVLRRFLLLVLLAALLLHPIRADSPSQAATTDLEPATPAEPKRETPADSESKPDGPEGSKPGAPANSDESIVSESSPDSPADSTPDEPDESKPVEPEDTKPDRSAESESNPDSPADSKPDKPEESKPAEPADSKPDKPEESKPAEPADSKPDAPAEPGPDTSAVKGAPTETGAPEEQGAPENGGDSQASDDSSSSPEDKGDADYTDDSQIEEAPDVEELPGSVGDLDEAGPCATDINTFCSTVKPGGSHLAECIQNQIMDEEQGATEFTAQITENCKAALLEYKVKLTKNINMDASRRRACKADAHKMCKFEVEAREPFPGKVIACLTEKKHALSKKCAESIYQSQVEAAQDYRLNAVLYQVCRKDADNVCAQVEPGAGRVNACLRDKRLEVRHCQGRKPST